MKNINELKVEELNRSESIEVHGGGMLDAIKRRIVSTINELLSGRPQL